jgi:hypothetical protein
MPAMYWHMPKGLYLPAVTDTDTNGLANAGTVDTWSNGNPECLHG